MPNDQQQQHGVHVERIEAERPGPARAGRGSCGRRRWPSRRRAGSGRPAATTRGSLRSCENLHQQAFVAVLDQRRSSAPRRPGRGHGAGACCRSESYSTQAVPGVLVTMQASTASPVRSRSSSGMATKPETRRRLAARRMMRATAMFERKMSTAPRSPRAWAAAASACSRGLAGCSAAITSDAAMAIAAPSRNCPSDRPFSSSHIASSDAVRSG